MPETNDKKIAHVIGRRIREERTKIGFSQEMLALDAGVDRTYICKVEAGTVNMTIKSLLAICAACGISLRSFFDDAAFEERFDMNGKDRQNERERMDQGRSGQQADRG